MLNFLFINTPKSISCRFWPLF